MKLFEGGDDIFFIKFLLMLEDAFVKHPWMFIYLPSCSSSDPTEKLTILESDPNFFNLNRIHSDQSEKALEAMRLFRQLLGTEPLSFVDDTLSNSTLSPRKRITKSIEILIRSYTNNFLETKGLLDKMLANLPSISQFSEISLLTDHILIVNKHLDRLDTFYFSKTGGSSCKLSNSQAVTTLVQKLEGHLFFTARDRIQSQLTESTRNLRVHAEKMADFLARRGGSSQEASMRDDTEQEELQALHVRYSARGVARVSPSGQGPPSRLSPAPSLGSPIAGPPPPRPPPRGPPPPRLLASGQPPSMSPGAGLHSPGPFRQAMSGDGPDRLHQDHDFDFYGAMRAICERAQRLRKDKEMRYLRDRAQLDRPPPSFSLMEAFLVLREATRVHTSSSSSSSSSSMTSFVQPTAFVSTSQDHLAVENARLRSEILALQQSSPSPRSGRSPSFDRQPSNRGRDRSPSPFDRSPRSSSPRSSSPSRGRSHERENSVEKKHRPQDDVKWCNEFIASGRCKRGDDCRFSHPRGFRSGSPHPSRGGGGDGGGGGGGF